MKWTRTAIAMICTMMALAIAGCSGGWVESESGLKYTDRVIGTGEEAVAGKKVAIHYSGWLDDGGGKHGRLFDTSRDGDQPYRLTLGHGEVIRGWDEGIVGMKLGGKRELIIPPNLAYGDRGFPGFVPPNATLIFELELVEVGQ